jgi:hypothetical protein
VGTVSLVGGDFKNIVSEDTIGWDVNVEANNTDKGLRINVLGETGKTIRWVAFVREIKSIE